VNTDKPIVLWSHDLFQAHRADFSNEFIYSHEISVEEGEDDWEPSNVTMELATRNLLSDDEKAAVWHYLDRGDFGDDTDMVKAALR